MTQLESTLTTQPELAELLGIEATGSELIRLFGHLRRTHRLRVYAKGGTPRHDPADVQRALKECDEECTPIDEQLNTEDFVPDHLRTDRELKSAAIAKGLITERDVDALAEPHMKATVGLDGRVGRIRELNRLNLMPVCKIGETNFYRPDDAQLAIDRWVEFNTGRAEELAERQKPAKQRPAAPHITPKDYREIGGVLKEHICIRFGISPAPPSRSSNFTSQLRRIGMRSIGTKGHGLIYDPNVVDAFSSRPAVGDWPGHVNIVPCTTVTAFLEKKPGVTLARGFLAFEKHLLAKKVPFYRDDQPGVYRLADLEVIWSDRATLTLAARNCTTVGQIEPTGEPPVKNSNLWPIQAFLKDQKLNGEPIDSSEYAQIEVGLNTYYGLKAADRLMGTKLYLLKDLKRAWKQFHEDS